MKLLKAELKSHLNAPVTLHFQEKVHENQYLSNGSYTLTLVSVEESPDGLLRLHLTNNMDREAKSSVDVNIPNEAKVTKKDSHWNIEYQDKDRIYKIVCNFPLATKELNLPKSSKAFVKEFKDSDGTIRKLNISIPENEGNVELFDKAKEIIEQILKKWMKFTFTTRNEHPVRGSLENIVYVFDTIMTVPLPGGVFFEVQAHDDEEDKTFALGTEMLIDLANNTITFAFDGQDYELRKASSS